VGSKFILKSVFRWLLWVCKQCCETHIFFNKTHKHNASQTHT